MMWKWKLTLTLTLIGGELNEAEEERKKVLGLKLGSVELQSLAEISLYMGKIPEALDIVIKAEVQAEREFQLEVSKTGRERIEVELRKANAEAKRRLLRGRCLAAEAGLKEGSKGDPNPNPNPNWIEGRI